MWGDSEVGQAHLLAMCFSLPVIVITIFFICQASWLAYQQLSLDHALLNVGRSLDAVERAALADAEDVDRQLQEAILADWTHLDASALSVSGSNYQISNVIDTIGTADGSDGVYGIRNYAEERNYMRIRAAVSYRVALLFPLPWASEITLERSLDRTHMLSMRFEVDADV